MKQPNNNPIVSIIMGSDSDLPVMQDAANLLEELNISYEITIVSAHRTPERMYEYAKAAEEKGLQVIIAGAGGSAHLPGMTASLTTLPVIGVPIKTKTVDGLDSLLSIVQMPPGIPVATVAVNGAKNAGLLAAKIIGVSDKTVQNKLKEYARNLQDSVLKKVEKLDEEGFKKYLEESKK
jgi:5-(carboxyamino)imidazole ribonucleotide mutase